VATGPVSLDLEPESPGWLMAHKGLVAAGILLLVGMAAVVAWKTMGSSTASSSLKEKGSVAKVAQPGPSDASTKPQPADSATADAKNGPPTPTEPLTNAANDKTAEKTVEKTPSDVSKTNEASQDKEATQNKPASEKTESPAEKSSPQTPAAADAMTDTPSKETTKGETTLTESPKSETELPKAENDKADAAESGKTLAEKAADTLMLEPEEKKDAAAEKSAATESETKSDEPSEPTSVETIKKLAPVQVDLAIRLNDPIPAIELTDIPLDKAFHLLSLVGSLPITLDLDTLASLGVSPQDSVSINLKDTTLGDALKALAEKCRLAVAVKSGQVLVTAPADYLETIRRVRYTVSDLVGKDQTPIGELADVVRKLVAPDAWQVNQGQGAVEPDGDVLIIAQTGDVHQQVLFFCEKLRIARKLPLRSRIHPERFSLMPRSEIAEELLSKPVTFNFHEPKPLNKIVEYIADAAKCNILFDHVALAAFDTSDRVEASVVADKQPLGEVLTELLHPLGLAYRVVSANVLQITTQESLDSRMELEFYPVKPLLTAGLTGPALVDQLKSEVAADTWSQTDGKGEIYFDAPSNYLLILQSRPVQESIRQWLKKLPKGRE
jgi:hypothetical protein